MTTIPTGRFVWFDYVAKDQAKATGFYGELFGWKTQTIPVPGGGTYTMFTVNDQMIGGFMPTPKGAPEAGHWLSQLQVADATAAADKVTALGGKVLKAPEKMGEFGTMAIVADSLDGAFALWQPAKAEGTGDFKGQPNTWCWNELYTQDTAKSVAFYSKLAGFTEKAMDMPSGTYHVLSFDGHDRAGVMTPPMPMPQAWMPYVQVANADQTVEKAKRLGATIHVAGDDVPGIGRIAILEDTQGGWLGLLQPAM
jgi:predicted enzyme related to lactoylglutathione lyase